MIYVADVIEDLTRIVVRDDLLVDNTAELMIERVADGEALYRENIRIAREPGFPVWHQVGEGRERCFGGPSHVTIDQARSRAESLLAGRVEHATGEAIRLAEDATAATGSGLGGPR